MAERPAIGDLHHAPGMALHTARAVVKAANKIAFRENVAQRRDPMLATIAAGRAVNTQRLEEATLQALAKLDMGEPVDLATPRAEYNRAENELQSVLDTEYERPRACAAWAQRERSVSAA